jgi:glycosyltransferase involved in cell wall biosynthesis
LCEANWRNIDHVSFVSEHTRRHALEVFKGFPFDKTSVIPNCLDDNKFTLKKKTGDARFTLGILGIVPKSKRLDLAIDLLEVLLKEDERYCLRVKGKHPLEYNWLLNRNQELAYYRNVFERINSVPCLRHKVIFDPPGDDVNEWFTMVGFILSPSDNESFHMAIGEGMLTGTIPVIWNWDGAGQIWGEKWVVNSVEQARDIIRNQKIDVDDRRKLSDGYPFVDVVNEWETVIKGL